MPELVIPSLAGGLANRLSDAIKKDDQLILCENMDMDEAMLGVVRPRKGVGKPYSPLDWIRDRDGNEIPGYKPSYILRTKPSGELFPRYKYLLVGGNYAHGIKRDAIFPESSYHFITDEMPFEITQMVEDADKLYIFSKSESPKVFRWGSDNDDIVRDMGYVMDMASLDITLTGVDDDTYGEHIGSGEDGIGSYIYCIVPTDKNGNLWPTDFIEKFKKIVSNSAVDLIRFSNLGAIREKAVELGYELGSNLYVYRTDRNGDREGIPVFRLVTILDWNNLDIDDSPDDDWTVSWDDHTPDASLTEVMSETGNLPPQDLRRVALWNNKMFGFSENSNILRFTEDWYYELWPVFNQIPIGNSDPIRAIIPRGSNLVIFKDAQTYEFWGSSKFNYNYKLISSMHGTNRPETVQAIDENRIVFVDRDNKVWLYDGSFTEISLPINIEGNYFRSAIMGRYYLLWAVNVWGRQGYNPNLLRSADGNLPMPLGGGDGDGGGEDEPPDDAPRPRDYPYRFEPGPDEDEEGDVEDPDEDEEGQGGTIYQVSPVFHKCYAYHIPTRKWTEFTGYDMKVREQPSRGGENSLLWYDGHDLVMAGDDNFNWIEEPLSVQSKFYFSTDYQEKRFRDIEVEIYNNSNIALNDYLVGRLYIFVDGDFDNTVEVIDLIYSAGRTGQQRLTHRFQNPILGKSISVKFEGNNLTKWFELRDIRLHYEPRGTPIRV